ncbi:hypothetical protein EVAR_24762_1 [Eumeta japonica]|uniref:Uncharacterized protein n=1 Tax=Eumeta variegata TaxID=151549 RepID=A0A4C1VDT6_EUMVA|nr:hypothetical protein EVAR_24762_1 [Eumeta japonica]
MEPLYLNPPPRSLPRPAPLPGDSGPIKRLIRAAPAVSGAFCLRTITSIIITSPESDTRGRSRRAPPPTRRGRSAFPVRLLDLYGSLRGCVVVDVLFENYISPGASHPSAFAYSHTTHTIILTTSSCGLPSSVPSAPARTAAAFSVKQTVISRLRKRSRRVDRSATKTTLSECCKTASGALNLDPITILINLVRARRARRLPLAALSQARVVTIIRARSDGPAIDYGEFIQTIP